MQVKPFKDNDEHTNEEQLPPLEGRLIGFANTKPELDAVLQALHSLGYSDSRITVLSGPEGIDRLTHLDEEFFFSDPEYRVIEFGLKELEAGHFSIGVEVEDRDAAARITDLATSVGGHSFQYIGVWVSERLSK